jgi:hypothetical protein
MANVLQHVASFSYARRFLACGSMVFAMLPVFRYLRSTSANNETQKELLNPLLRVSSI